MNQQYEHEGQPLNRPIIRAILRKCLVDSEVHMAINPQQEWLTVREFGVNIRQYHKQNGGAPMRVRWPERGPFRDELSKLKKQGKAEVDRHSREHLWKLIPSYEDESPIGRLVAVIQQERERLDAEIETLRQRVTQLDAILNELGLTQKTK